MSSARHKSRPTRRTKSSDSSEKKEVLSLRKSVQKRILGDVFESATGKDPGWKVLILDDHATSVISAAVGMYDIMERKVTVVESLKKLRAPFPDMGAIYLLEPSSQSVDMLLADFTSGKILYGKSVFLYFLGRLPDSLLSQIKTCRPLLKRLKALGEINVDFLAKEDRAFTFNMEKSFPSLYLRKSNTPIEVQLAEKLVTVCATLNEYPHIRYKQSSALCTSLASVFHLKMDEFVAQNPNWWYHGGSSNGSVQRERGVLLLLDRADDCLTPLMHDFTYQSMVHDLLPVKGDCITFQSETTSDPDQTEAKDVLLDEKDALWVELRGKHIAEVIQTLSERIREIMSSSTGSTLGKKAGSGNMSLGQMAAALKALPEYREVMSKLSQHMHISHTCMDTLKSNNLIDLSELEQILATGKDDEGRSPKLNDVMDKAEHQIMKMKNPSDRLRLILIATIAQGGLRQQDRRRLMNAAELTRKHMRVLNSLEVLGLNIFSSNDKRLVSMLTGGRVGSGYGEDEDSEYALSRYKPAMKGVLEELASNTLSLEEYPSVLPMPEPAPSNRVGTKSVRGPATSARRSGEAASARKSAGVSNRWSKSTSSGNETKKSGSNHYTGGRCIVFVMGGASYSELRLARDVMESESREIVMGSTAFVSPHDFIADLQLLAEEDE